MKKKRQNAYIILQKMTGSYLIRSDCQRESDCVRNVENERKLFL